MRVPVLAAFLALALAASGCGGDPAAVPQPLADLFTTDEDTPLAIEIAGLLVNDGPAGTDLEIVRFGNPSFGSVVRDGAFVRFIPPPNESGESTFTYTVSNDGAEASAAVIVTVLPVDDPPMVTGESAATNEDVAIEWTVASLLANDVEVDGEPLSIASVATTTGTVTLADGRVAFTPPVNFNGEASVRYGVSDGRTEVDGVVLVTVNPVNDAPMAVADAFTIDEDEPLRILRPALLANDVDVDGDDLVVSAVGEPSNGAVSFAGREVVFRPAANFSGEASFQYTASDGIATSSGKVTIDVRPVDDPPVAVDDLISTDEDVSAAVQVSDVLSNDVDVDGDPISLVSVQTAVGQVSLNDGVITYSPQPDFFGEAEITYEIAAGGSSGSGRILVTVLAVNDPPVAINDRLQTDEDQALIVPTTVLTGNDIDVDQDVLTVTDVDEPTNGTVALVDAGIRFEPLADYFGEASFNYRVSDGNAEAEGRVTVRVVPVNDPPVVADDTRSTLVDTELVLQPSDLLANDADADGDALEIVSVGAALNGTVELDSGSIRFGPSAGFVGVAGFEYAVTDGVNNEVGRVQIDVVRCLTGQDTDGDRLDDCVETGTLVYVSPEDTGTSPDSSDTDGDGLDDGDEVLGTTDGLDLPGLGANPLRKDIFIEYDWLDDSNDCGAHSHRVTPEVAERLVRAFAEAPVDNPDGSTGIVVHQDYGQGGNMTGGNLVPDDDGFIDGGVTNGLDADFDAKKSAHFDPARRGYFHYAILAHRYLGGSTSSSGVAELPGDDMIVSLQCSLSPRFVANTIMHELGHNLGLRHGGNENCNYKPNYNSVMNYQFQFDGIDTDCDAFGDGRLGYSDGRRIVLNESALNERDGVCGSPGIDWNRNGEAEDAVSINLNAHQQEAQQCGGTLTVLRDHDDWASLVFSPVSDGDRPDIRRIIVCEATPED